MAWKNTHPAAQQAEFLAYLLNEAPTSALAEQPRRNLIKWYAAALACFILGGFSISMDIGKIDHIFSMIFSFKPASPMAQDFWSLDLCVIVALVGLFASRNGNVGKTFGLTSIIAACLLVVIEGLMLAAAPARAFWGGGTAASFLVGMALAGFAVSLLLESDGRRTPGFRKGFIAAVFEE